MIYFFTDKNDSIKKLDDLTNPFATIPQLYEEQPVRKNKHIYDQLRRYIIRQALLIKF